MQKNEPIKRASTEEIAAMRARGEIHSDWQAAEAMSRAEIERLAEEDDGPIPAGWENMAVIGIPPRKEPVHIRLDTDVLQWFRAHGPGYQTRINAVLRAFVESREQRERV